MGRKSGICKRKDRQAEFWPCAGLRGREEIMEQKESRLKALKIGQLVAKRPVIQGGMGIGISLSSLAGAVAKAGGIGIISTAQIGFRDPDFEKNPLEANKQAIHQELKKAREIAPQGIIGFNIMAASRDYGQYVKEAVRAGADVIISGAGLPVDMPKFVAEAEAENLPESVAVAETADPGTKEAANAAFAAGGAAGTGTDSTVGTNGRRTMIAPIVSSVKSTLVICRMWDRKYQTAPDFVVIEGPCAGGHLGFSREQLTAYGADTECVSRTYHQAESDEEIHGIIRTVKEYAEKYGKEIPVISAGGIFDHEDVLHQLSLGADGVQAATRFVTTVECDAPSAYKQAYLDAGQEDIVIVKSPVGMPGRAIKNKFLERAARGPIPPERCVRCLDRCDPASTPYCITRALIQAARGNLDEALLFCGSNAYRCERVETVEEVMRALCGEENARESVFGV